jgi:hypothetical protein
MDTMTYASVAVLPESVANSTRRLLVPEVELTPLDLSYLGKSSPPSENSDPDKIDAELAFQRSLDRLDC